MSSYGFAVKYPIHSHRETEDVGSRGVAGGMKTL